jgi:hypothetical protein
VLPYPPTTAFAERRIRRVTVTQDECIPFPLPVGLAVFVINHTYANGPGVVTAADGDGSAYGRPLTCHYLQLVDAPRPAGLPGCFCAVCVAGQLRFTPERRYQVMVFPTAGPAVTDRFGQNWLVPRALSQSVSSVGSPAGPSQAARAPTAGCLPPQAGRNADELMQASALQLLQPLSMPHPASAPSTSATPASASVRRQLRLLTALPGFWSCSCQPACRPACLQPRLLACLTTCLRHRLPACRHTGQ